MKNKYHINISFNWGFFWVGLFFEKSARSLYICLLPMFPIKIWVTQHHICPECGACMQKTAYDISPEGFDLQWNCETCEERGEESQIEIDWCMDFPHTEWVNKKDLEHFGYVVS